MEAEPSAPRPITVAILTPCLGEIKAATAVSIANAMAHFLMVKYGAELQCAWEIIRSSNLAQSRQQLIQRAMQMGATHILFWDSDIAAPADVIPRMLNHSRPIVCANYPTKEMVSRPTVYVDNDDVTGPLWTAPGDEELVEGVSRAGLGLMMIDGQVFDYLDLPWFSFEPVGPDYILIRGEDHYFCDKARSKGIPIVCDQKLSNEIGHYGDFEYTNDWALKSEATRQAIYNGEVPKETAKEAAE